MSFSEIFNQEWDPEIGFPLQYELTIDFGLLN